MSLHHKGPFPLRDAQWGPKLLKAFGEREDWLSVNRPKVQWGSICAGVRYVVWAPMAQRLGQVSKVQKRGLIKILIFVHLSQ